MQFLQNKGTEISAPFIFISPVAEAAATERSGMPAEWTVVHRAAAAIGPAMPARSAATGHRNGGGVRGCRLIERRHWHRRRRRHRRKTDANRKQRGSECFHESPFRCYVMNTTCALIEIISPMVVMPMTMVPVVTVPVVVMPAHLDRLHLVDLVLRHDGLFNVRRRPGCRPACERRHGSSLCACGKHDRARDQSSIEIRKTPKFHDVTPLS